MGVGHEGALKQYMMVRNGAVGQVVPVLQKSWWVWAEVRRNSVQFQWFGAQAWWGTGHTFLGGLAGKASRGTESGMEHSCALVGGGW